uniref:Uncharacterized protein n=1 Tax=Moniliophthora roreri TaxID=221103 RepID=A0A0W0G2A3_MONRR
MDLSKSLTGGVNAVPCKELPSNVLPASEVSAPLTTVNSQPESDQVQVFTGPVTPAITIRDAAGRDVPMPAGGQVDLKCVQKYLEYFFYNQGEPISDVLLKFIEEGQYSLAIDEGRQVIKLENGEKQWARVMPGTKIVMSVILWQIKKRISSGYECPICKTWNSGQKPGLNMAEDCCNPECNGRFQAFEEDQDYNQAGSNEKQNKDRNIKILQNLHIMQLSVYINGRYITVYWSGLDYECQDEVSVPAICNNRAALTVVDLILTLRK